MSGLFGPQAPVATPSLFSQPSTPKPNLFGSTPQTTGLFGPQKQAGTGTAWGTPATTPTPQQNNATGGLFGSSSTNPNPSQPATTNSLFGGPTTQATNTVGGFGSTAQAPATGGLFGSSTSNNNNNNNAQNQSGGGLFGSSLASTGLGIFGGSSSGTGTNSNSLFGSKPATVPTTNSQSLFGASTATTTNANATSTSGTLLRTTRFNDLPDDVKRQLESLDGMIQNQCRLADTIKATELGREINEGTILLRQLKAEMHSTSSLVNDSATSLERLRKSVDGDVADVLKLGTGTGLSKFQLDYFLRTTAGLEDRMRSYEQTLEFVEIQLKGLTDRPNPAAIIPAIKAQYGTFMVLADRVAALVERLKIVKEGFREIWRHQTGSVQDPFGGSLEDV